MIRIYELPWLNQLCRFCHSQAPLPQPLNQGVGVLVPLLYFPFLDFQF